MNKVIIYSMDDCVECTFVKKMLDEEAVSYEIRDITKSLEYKKEVEQYGFLGVPVTVVGDRAFKGFTPELIELVESLKS